MKKKPVKKVVKKSPAKKTMEHKNRNPFNWIEIPVTDIERAKIFYGKVFGFKFEMLTMGELQMAFFPAAMEGWGCGGSLMQSDMYTPSHEGPMVYLAVADIESTLSKVEAAFGRIFQHKKSIGKFGFVGYFEDSEGNRIGLHSMN